MVVTLFFEHAVCSQCCKANNLFPGSGVPVLVCARDVWIDFERGKSCKSVDAGTRFCVEIGTK